MSPVESRQVHNIKSQTEKGRWSGGARKIDPVCLDKHFVYYIDDDQLERG